MLGRVVAARSVVELGRLLYNNKVLRYGGKKSADEKVVTSNCNTKDQNGEKLGILSEMNEWYWNQFGS